MFTAWCTWSSVIWHGQKRNTVQTHPKLFVNNEQIPALKNNESFKYLGRYFNFEMDNEEHKKELYISYYQQNIEKSVFFPLNCVRPYNQDKKISIKKTIKNKMDSTFI